MLLELSIYQKAHLIIMLLKSALGKDNLLVSKYYSRFTNLKAAITNYYRTKRFKLDITRYLLRNVS